MWAIKDISHVSSQRLNMNQIRFVCFGLFLLLLLLLLFLLIKDYLGDMIREKVG